MQYGYVTVEARTGRVASAMWLEGKTSRWFDFSETFTETNKYSKRAATNGNGAIFIAAFRS
jgi:hypothetical protein